MQSEIKSNLRLLFLLIFVTAGTGLLWYLDGNEGNISSDKYADFAIEDTSEIVKIFIADNYGSTLLEREVGDEYWVLNGEFKARKSSTDLLLKTFNRAAVKGAVPEQMRETVIRNLAGAAKKVEIYTGREKPEKIWYVGSATPSHTGTYMLLEIPGEGKADEPFIVHMEGFTGFLTTRFFTNEKEWKYTGIFNYPNRSLQTVEFVNSKEEQNTYILRADTAGILNMYIKSGIEIVYTDTLRIQDHFLRFNKVHFESFNSRLTVEQEEELKQTTPNYTITCTDFDGVSTTVFLYEKDEEHLYGVTEDGQVVLVQTFVFNPLIVGTQQLIEIN
tara:strand:- start:403 stop:1395 length:993 start_codon:yes stop_codon:yes gene_type:complete